MSQIITAETVDKTPFSAKDILLAAATPASTKSYSPVSHKDVMNFTLEQIDKAGLKLVTERYSANKDGMIGMGFYHIEGFGDAEMGMELAWQNSLDKSLSLKWAIGGRVFICSNGMVRGDIGTFKRKHTGTVLDEYAEAVKRYVGDAEMHFAKLLADKEMMKGINVSPRKVAEMLGRMYIEKDILNATQLNIVKRELTKPTFDYKADGTLWQLYNHCTVALKEAHPLHHMNQHTDLHEFVTKEYQLWD